MKIYIAGPFFTDQQRIMLDQLITIVRKNFPNAELFIPKEHVIDKECKLPNSVWAKYVFDMDVENLNCCDIIAACYLGMYSDTGTAWEIGYAYAKGKTIMLFAPEEVNSLMIMQSSDLRLGPTNQTQEQK